MGVLDTMKLTQTSYFSDLHHAQLKGMIGNTFATKNLNAVALPVAGRSGNADFKKKIARWERNRRNSWRRGDKKSSRGVWHLIAWFEAGYVHQGQVNWDGHFVWQVCSHPYHSSTLLHSSFSALSSSIFSVYLEAHFREVRRGMAEIRVASMPLDKGGWI